MSTIIVTALLAFVGTASGVLLWDGLATAHAHAADLTGHERWHARAELTVGALGVALVLWIVSGILTHAW